jgi:site-specific DNA-cytosine methylase
MRDSAFVELCAGIGGMRAGLTATGWTCELAIDVDADAVEAHRAAFGDCVLADVRELDFGTIPTHDLLVSGFPCQPFSSSGDRTGFDHQSGNVFEHVAELCGRLRPRAILLENVKGLLSNAYGHTFACILRKLTSLGYEVAWGTLDSEWFGIPQQRQRVFIVGTRVRKRSSARPKIRAERFPPTTSSDVFAELLSPQGAATVLELPRLIEERQPRIGLRRPEPPVPFGPLGYAIEDHCWSWPKARPKELIDVGNLGDIVCPSFVGRDMVRSVRYWGHSGITRPYFKARPLAHCVGTNIGAGPTFGVANEAIRTTRDRENLLEFANWVREEPGHLVFRITPSRAALLFGPHIARIEEALELERIGVTKRYELLGNMVVPEIARRLGESIRRHLSDATRR